MSPRREIIREYSCNRKAMSFRSYCNDDSATGYRSTSCFASLRRAPGSKSSPSPILPVYSTILHSLLIAVGTSYEPDKRRGRVDVAISDVSVSCQARRTDDRVTFPHRAHGDTPFAWRCFLEPRSSCLSGLRFRTGRRSSGRWRYSFGLKRRTLTRRCA